MTTYLVKDPSALLDFSFDWGQWLDVGETITGHAFTISPATVDGLTLNRSEVVGTVAVAWVQGGVDGKRYRLTCQITTSNGRVDERSQNINVEDR